MSDEFTPERPDLDGPADEELARPDAGTRDDGPATTALQEDPESIRQERDEYRDRFLRMSADFDNYRKRVERDRRELAEFAASELMRDLLPLVDDLERALEGDAGATVTSYRTGVELIHRQLIDLLRKRGVTPIEALGADFDPNLHHAVSQESSPEHREGEVLAELRRGYKLGDRLLRASMVKVATRD